MKTFEIHLKEFEHAYIVQRKNRSFFTKNNRLNLWNEKRRFEQI